jgi:hypothetical protein
MASMRIDGCLETAIVNRRNQPWRHNVRCRFACKHYNAWRRRRSCSCDLLASRLLSELELLIDNRVEVSHRTAIQRMPQTHATKDHRTNRFLAALEPEDYGLLEPHLETINLHRGQVLYEPDEPLRYTYFPHDAIVSLVAMMENGSSAEIAVFGREALFGLVSAVVSRQSFGRYIVQLPALPRGSALIGCTGPSAPVRMSAD